MPTDPALEGTRDSWNSDLPRITEPAFRIGRCPFSAARRRFHNFPARGTSNLDRIQFGSIAPSRDKAPSLRWVQSTVTEVGGAMQALSFGAAALGVAVAAWIFFDATDRGKKYAWLWALGFLVLLVTLVGSAILLIVYFAQRNSGRRQVVAEGAALRLYLIDATFTALALMVAGAATAMAAGLLYAVSDHLSNSDFRDLAASALSAFIVGAAVWLPHWRAVAKRLDHLDDDAEFRALYVLRTAETLVATFVFGIVALGNALVVLGGGISALFHTTHANAAWWLPELGIVIATGLAAWFHADAFRRGSKSHLGLRFQAIPAPRLIEPKSVPPVTSPPAPQAYPPAPQAYAPAPQAYAPAPQAYPPAPQVEVPAEQTPSPWAPPGIDAAVVTAQAPPPPPAETQAARVPRSSFCPHCGSPLEEGDAFCRSCGTKIERVEAGQPTSETLTL